MSTLLIAGANRGLGLEFVRQYNELGWRILACCRKPEQADGLQRLAANSERRVSVHQLDVDNHAQIKALSMSLADTPIDILLCNAGFYGKRRLALDQLDFVQMQQILWTNSIGPIAMAQAFEDQVAASELKLIAAITSKMGSIGDNQSGGAYAYRAGKAALNAMVKSLSLDLAPRGIRALVLHPGWVKTDMGGPNALIDAPTSIRGMRAVMERAETGMFYNYDGQVIPW